MRPLPASGRESWTTTSSEGLHARAHHLAAVGVADHGGRQAVRNLALELSRPCVPGPSDARAIASSSTPARAGWLMTDAEPFDAPIPARGFQGFWQWPERRWAHERSKVPAEQPISAAATRKSA
jgi:hypothetical protein